MSLVHEAAPSFELPADGGRIVRSSELAGAPYVLYFYPKDDTPGCTTEACDFRDHFGRITASGATVLGVSKDGVKSHDRFKAKHELPFTLLSDAELALHRAYGAWGSKKLYGKDYEGTIRSTFLIDRDGRVAAEWRNVKVKGHVDEVLAAIAGL